MKLRLLATVVVLTLTTVAAQAQNFGIYVAPIAAHISNSVADTGPFAFLGPNSKSQMFYGVDLGGYYNFFHQGKLDVGLDVRDSIIHGNSAALNSFLVGARVTDAPFKRPIKPFIQLSVGAGTSRPPSNPLKITKLQYGVFAGADYTLNRHFDWRVAEIGYGSLTTVSNATVGGTATVPASTILTVSTGIVVRF